MIATSGGVGDEVAAAERSCGDIGEQQLMRRSH